MWSQAVECSLTHDTDDTNSRSTWNDYLTYSPTNATDDTNASA